MSTPNPSPSLLQQLKGSMDTLLVVDVFVVIGGAIWFAVAVTLHSQHIEAPWSCFSGCGSRFYPGNWLADGSSAAQRGAGLVAAARAALSWGY